MEWVPAAHAVTVFSHGPWKPYFIEIAAGPALAIIMGTRNGETLTWPLLEEVLDLFLERLDAADPGADPDADLCGVGDELTRLFQRLVGGRPGRSG